MEGRGDVHHRAADAGDRSVFMPDHTHLTGECLDKEIHRRVPGARSLMSEAGDRAINNVRVNRLDGFWPDAKSVGDAGAKSDHIRVFAYPQIGVHGLRIFQIEGNTAFRPIDRGRESGEVAAFDEGQIAAGFVTIRRFNFNDVGAEIAQQKPAIWGGEDDAQFYDLDSFEWLLHTLAPDLSQPDEFPATEAKLDLCRARPRRARKRCEKCGVGHGHATD